MSDVMPTIEEVEQTMGQLSLMVGSETVLPTSKPDLPTLGQVEKTMRELSNIAQGPESTPLSYAVITCSPDLGDEHVALQKELAFLRKELAKKDNIIVMKDHAYELCHSSLLTEQNSNKKELAKKDEELAKKDEELAAINKKMATLQKESTGKKDDDQTEFDAMRSDFADIRTKLTTMDVENQTKLETMQTENQTKLETMRTEFQTKLETMQTDNQMKLDAMRTEHQTELDAMRSDFTDMRAKITNLDQVPTLEVLSSDTVVPNSQNDHEMERRILDIEDNNEYFEGRRKYLEETCESLITNMGVLEARVKDLETRPQTSRRPAPHKPYDGVSDHHQAAAFSHMKPRKQR